MSFKLQFSALSLGASVDQQTGSLSVFDVIDEIAAPQLPIHIPSLSISMAFEKITPTAETAKLFIHLVTPDGKNAKIGEGEMSPPAEQRRLKAVFRLGTFPITQFGAHRFVVSWLNGNREKQGEAILDFGVVQMSGANPGGNSGANSSGRAPLPN